MVVVDGDSTKDEGDYGSNGLLCFENPLSIGSRKDENFHERQSLTKRQHFTPTMCINEIFEIAVSLMRPKENNHEQYVLPNVV